MSKRHNSPYRQVRRAFDRTALKRVCEMYELDFEGAYPDLETYIVEERKYDNFYFYADRGSDILAVAHLDTVVDHKDRQTTFAETKGGPVVHSGALDDRLGAYIILELLPKLGLNHDILLTVGEEGGRSTAEFFETEKHYNWIIEFDRGGTDVVMYRYQNADMSNLVRESGARVGSGSFTDICELEHLGVKAFNWGTGYRDYHTVRGYAFLEDTYQMVISYLKFHEANRDLIMPHEKKTWSYSYSGGGGYGSFGGAGVGGGRGTGKWDIDKKKWVYPDDPDPKIKINGKEYDSYEDWWDEAHPDEAMVETTNLPARVDEDLWANDWT